MKKSSLKSNLAKHQKFEAVTINRAQIKNAPYNPRKIENKAFELLRKNIKRVGLIETLVWNEVTGNIISGHQRLKIMDMLEGRSDYDLTVAKVSLDEKEEKEQNIFMNNTNSQGDWDFDILKELVLEIDPFNAGLEKEDLNVLGIELDLGRHQDSDIEAIINTFDKIKLENREANKAKNEGGKGFYTGGLDVLKDKERIGEKLKEQNGGGFTDIHEDYIVISFNNWQHKEAFLKRFGFPERERYIKGELFEIEINKHLGQ